MLPSTMVDPHLRMTRTPGVTLKDVAKAAGVSPMAVSVALNGSTSRARVSDETRKRIQAIAEHLGYRANSIARSLHRQRSDIIGLWSGRKVFNANSPFTAAILHGIQLGCAEHGKDFLLHGAVMIQGRDSDEVAYRELADGKIDGVIIDAEPDDPRIERLRRTGLALVSIVEVLAGVPSVLCDDAAAGRLMCAHIHERGHRRVLWRSLIHPVMSQIARRGAFLDEAQRRGMAVEMSTFGYDSPGLTADEHALLDPARSGRCTALVGFADNGVPRVLDDLDRLGWSVPGQIAVAGFDGLSQFMEATPRHALTTVVMPWGEVARQAVGILARLIDGQPAPQCTVLPVDLRIGTTT